MIEDHIAAHASELRAIRHDLHAHPELLFDLPRTSGIVAKELARLGFKVTTGIAETGVVGTISNGTSRKAIGIRADMDALPIHETTNLAFSSRTPGRMHACGHDGHTTILLGAARYLAETKNFDGTVHLIFQPAEEDISGAKQMVEEGIFKRFHCDAIFALHNLPGEETGQILVRPGAITAAVDIILPRIIGVGGHGAIPHKSIDPIVAASSIVLTLQTLVSRNLDPLEAAVVTVGAFNAGTLATIIPEDATLDIGLRTCSKDVRVLMLERIHAIIEGQAKSFGCRVEYRETLGGASYPAGFNDAASAAVIREIALEMGQSPEKVDLKGPFMFSEDFAYFQEAVPACYFAIGNGPSRNLHDPGYDFNDDLIVKASAVWGRLVERFLPKS